MDNIASIVLNNGFIETMAFTHKGENKDYVQHIRYDYESNKYSYGTYSASSGKMLFDEFPESHNNDGIAPNANFEYIASLIEKGGNNIKIFARGTDIKGKLIDGEIKKDKFLELSQTSIQLPLPKERPEISTVDLMIRLKGAQFTGELIQKGETPIKRTDK